MRPARKPDTLPRVKRRHFLHLTAGLTASAALADSPRESEQSAIRALAEGYLKEQGFRGMSIAYGREGRIDFEAGYGFAEASGKEPVTPADRFRIASVSKPITATTVLMCVEKGLLKLDDPVFGSKGILGGGPGGDVDRITVDHLLTHTSGGWPNKKDDPMFLNPAMKHKELIAWTLANQKLENKPGENYAYSNFGYCVLGRVLEKVTRQPYEDLVTKGVLARCGVTGMKIGGNTLRERQKNEVMYVTDPPTQAYGMNVARMDSHGGWIATAGDLVRFASQLPALLSADSVRTMTTPGPAGGGYARGWNVNTVPNWWHTGSLPGTTTIMVHTARGMCWAALVNGRKEGSGPALDKLMWQMGKAVASWTL